MRGPLAGDAARVYLAILLLTSSDGLVSTLASPFLRSLGYPLADIGLLVSAYAIASLVSRLPAGRFSEGRHAHTWLIGSCLVYAGALAAYPIAVEPWALWSVRIVHGLAFGTATTLNFATFLTISEGANRGRATAFYTTGMAAGYTIGNFTSGFIADHLGYGVAFVGSALCPLLALLAIRPAPVTPQRAVSSSTGLLGMWSTLRNPEVRAVPMLAFCLNFTNQALSTLFPLYVLSVGQTLSIAGTARGLQSLSNTIARPFGGGIVRRLGPVALGAGGIAVAGVSYAAVPLTTVPALFLAMFVVAGLGRAAGVLSNAMTTVDLSERGVLKRGTASALMSAGGDAGAIVAPIVAGATAAQIGIQPALQMLPIAAALVGVAFVLASRRQPAGVAVRA